MREALPTGTVTLLLADVEGSTRLWESEPEPMAEAMARLDRILAETVAGHGGVRPVEQVTSRVQLAQEAARHR